jgi:DMSO/TMAO reductase YedYZ molybdopterin-dependent catalytic subunit
VKTDRRRFLQRAKSGTAVLALGGLWWALDDDLTDQARAQTRPDGRPRLPPGQKVIKRLRAMGGSQGNPARSKWRLKIHGEVESPFSLDFAELLAMEQTRANLDVHCVTSWSVMGAPFVGVPVSVLAALARPTSAARHVIFEAAHGYTANVPIAEALAPQNLVAHQYDGRALARENGSPVRVVVPDLYFWKSAKWLTGIRFAKVDAPGFWERRGYHNHADPWTEERHG